MYHVAAPGDFTFARLTRDKGGTGCIVIHGSAERFDEEENKALAEQTTRTWPHVFARLGETDEAFMSRYASNHIHGVPGDRRAELDACATPRHRLHRALAEMASLALGIDVGTSATKGVLVDADGQIVDSARVEHGFDQPQPGFAEQDAEKVWWGDTVAVIGG